jgi:hypothetical protein
MLQVTLVQAKPRTKANRGTSGVWRMGFAFASCGFESSGPVTIRAFCVTQERISQQQHRNVHLVF